MYKFGKKFEIVKKQLIYYIENSSVNVLVKFLTKSQKKLKNLNKTWVKPQ